MILKGSKYLDERGAVSFVNSFDLAPVVRMYWIEPVKDVIRAWQGHRKECKWFYCVKGSFLVRTVDIDTLDRVEYLLNSENSEVLKITPGLYNGFVALEEGSSLIVFSDSDLESSQEDDFRESLDNIEWEPKTD